MLVCLVVCPDGRLSLPCSEACSTGECPEGYTCNTEDERTGVCCPGRTVFRIRKRQVRIVCELPRSSVTHFGGMQYNPTSLIREF